MSQSVALDGAAAQTAFGLCAGSFLPVVAQRSTLCFAAFYANHWRGTGSLLPVVLTSAAGQYQRETDTQN